MTCVREMRPRWTVDSRIDINSPTMAVLPYQGAVPGNKKKTLHFQQGIWDGAQFSPYQICPAPQKKLFRESEPTTHFRLLYSTWSKAFQVPSRSVSNTPSQKCLAVLPEHMSCCGAPPIKRSYRNPRNTQNLQNGPDLGSDGRVRQTPGSHPLEKSTVTTIAAIMSPAHLTNEELRWVFTSNSEKIEL